MKPRYKYSWGCKQWVRVDCGALARAFMSSGLEKKGIFDIFMEEYKDRF